ncbi:hypothetical protein IAE22_32685 [Bacillus sp. S34]|nr:hypothetical protein [Bacillus sp. S34]
MELGATVFRGFEITLRPVERARDEAEAASDRARDAFTAARKGRRA